MADVIGLGIEGLRDHRAIGSGGFARVYAANDVAFDRTVAVKVLHADSDDGYRRFERELALMGRLGSHPNIVTAYRSGRTDHGAPYLVMEHLPGGSLVDLVARDGPLSVGAAAHIGRQIASALGHAHKAGIVHRDVTPANVLLAADGAAKLADFGISHLREATVSQRSFTPSHSPPETFAATECRDERSDLYSLASVIYQLVAGHPPFHICEGSLEGQMARILNEPVPRLGDDALDNFFASAMAKAPEDRFASAAELAAGLVGLAESADSVVSTVDVDTIPDEPLHPVHGSTPSPRTSTPVAGESHPTRPAVGPPPTPSGRTNQLRRRTGTVEGGGGRTWVPSRFRRPTFALVGIVAALAVAGGAMIVDAARSDQSAPPSTTISTGPAATPSTSSELAPDPGAGTPTDAAVTDTAPTPTTAALVVTHHSAPVTEIVELSDGRLATGSEDGSILVWDPDREGEEPTLLDVAGGEAVWDLAALPTGQLVSASVGGAVELWNLDEPDTEPVVLAPPSGAKAEVTVLADGRLAAAGLDGPVQVWDPAEPWAPVTELAESTRVVDHLTALPDGRVAYVNLVGLILVWDPNRPDVDPLPLSGVFNSTSELAVLPGGGLAVGSFEGVVVAYDSVDPGGGLDVYDTPTEQVWQLAALPEDQLAITTAGGQLHAWTMSSGEGEIVHASDDGEELTAMLAVDDGRLVFADDQGVVRLWDATRPSIEPTVATEHPGGVRSLVELSDGRLASGSTDGSVQVWSLPGRNP